jgi:Na+/melibiose symporter-like transporter
MVIGRTFWVILGLLIISLVVPSLPGIRGHDNEVQLFYHISLLWGFLIAASWIWTYLSLRRMDVRRQGF